MACCCYLCFVTVMSQVTCLFLCLLFCLFLYGRDLFDPPNMDTIFDSSELASTSRGNLLFCVAMEGRGYRQWIRIGMHFDFASSSENPPNFSAFGKLRVGCLLRAKTDFLTHILFSYIFPIILGV